MDFVSTDIKTMAYINSEAEYNRAKLKGFWERLLLRVLGQRACLLSFHNSAASVTMQASQLGLQEIALDDIVGSLDRSQDFTRHFWPCTGNQQGKERWRTIYTQVTIGGGLPPIELYKVGPDYFVKDGHHRVSVARYVGWPTIQANVTELIAAPVEGPGTCCNLDLCPQGLCH